MNINVVVERAGENWSAYAPDLDDVVVATGETGEEAVNNFREALLGLIRHKHQEGLPAPDMTELEVWETMTV